MENKLYPLLKDGINFYSAADMLILEHLKEFRLDAIKYIYIYKINDEEMNREWIKINASANSVYEDLEYQYNKMFKDNRLELLIRKYVREVKPSNQILLQLDYYDGSYCLAYIPLQKYIDSMYHSAKYNQGFRIKMLENKCDRLEKYLARCEDLVDNLYDHKIFKEIENELYLE